MSNITILHLSDIHFKVKEKQTFRDDVEEKMAAAIKAHLENNRAPDFVAVTGDITFSGKEYEKANAFFKTIKSLLPPGTVVLPVPGNHDVDREAISKYFSLHTIVRDKKTDGFLEDKKEIAGHILPKFKNFRAFADELHPGLYPSEADYFWVKDYEEKDVSFLGLNSGWACENDDDRNNITLGYPQVMNALGKAKNTNRVLLMHHPPFNWLNETDFNRYSGEIFYNCGLILHGHIHTHKPLVIKSPSGSSICLGATASYTDEKEGFIGFQFIEAEFGPGSTAVKVWPYRLDTRGRVRFIPDTHRWEGQDGPYFELEIAEKPSKKRKPAPAALEIPGTYKEWIRHFHSTMNIELLAKKGEVVQVSLPELYIPIQTRNPFHKPEKEEKRKVKSDELFLEPGETPGTETGTKESPYMDIEELVGRKNRVLLRGGAGTGKTTLIKHLAYTITHGSCLPSLRDYLPVLILFKELWPIYNEVLQETKKKTVFEDLLKLYLENCTCGLQWETAALYLSHRRVLFLVDGLDEIPRHLLPDLVDMIARFQFEHKENRFLLTGRPHGIAGRAEARFGGDLHDIEPISEEMAGIFIDKWFRAVSLKATGAAKVTAQSLVSDIRRHEHISVFIQNPLLLTAVCILYQDGKQIPEQRAELYNRIIDNLLYRRFHDPARPDRVHRIHEFLMNIAFDNQLKNRKTMETDDALALLKKTLPPLENETTPHYNRRVQDFFNEVEPDCGLFNRRPAGEAEPELEFIHLTFQEFLAAKHMVENEIDYTPFLEEGWWEETLLLYVGLTSITKKVLSNRIAESIIKAGDQPGFDGWFTAGFGPAPNLPLTGDPSKITPPDNVADRVESLFDPTKPLIDPSVLNRFLSGDASVFKEMGAPAEPDPHAIRTTRELLEKLRPLLSPSGNGGMLSWSAHLILHLLRAVNWKGNIAEVGGIVLIDDMDPHREAIPLLRECFPNLQFIAGTQSPETVDSLENISILLLEPQGEEIQVKQR